MSIAVQLGDATIDRSELAEVCQRYAVRELTLFGSAARNEMGPASDIDVMVDFAPGARIGVLKFVALSEELEALAGRKVDLVTKRGLKPWVRDEVLKDARVIYRRSDQSLRFLPFEFPKSAPSRRTGGQSPALK